MKINTEKNKDKVPVIELSPLLTADTMHEIFQYLSYKDGLYAFRQTSRHYNELAEKIFSGQLARRATNLEPSWIRTSLDSFCSEGNIRLILAVISAALGFMMISYCSEAMNQLNVLLCLVFSWSGFFNALMLTYYLSNLYKQFTEDEIEIYSDIFFSTIGMVAGVFFACHLWKNGAAGMTNGSTDMIQNSVVGITLGSAPIGIISGVAPKMVRMGIFANKTVIKESIEEQFNLRYR
ncbi:F-box protein [uncultured Legionella sp.]|uniref:F-box protein n=1 Tax=uncultured Legionella sp. TaxID=210934 RepID=UPI00261D8D07|nr:F-box protein [uncultured Legionella sp.]